MRLAFQTRAFKQLGGMHPMRCESLWLPQATTPTSALRRWCHGLSGHACLASHRKTRCCATVPAGNMLEPTDTFKFRDAITKSLLSMKWQPYTGMAVPIGSLRRKKQSSS